MHKKRTGLTIIIDALILLYTCGIYLLSVYPETNIIFRIIAFALMGICAFYMLIKRRCRFSKLIGFFAAFVLFCIFSTLWAADMAAAEAVCGTLAQLFMVFFLVYNYAVEENKVHYLVLVIMLSGVIFAVYSVLLFGVEAFFAGMIEGSRVGAEDSTLNLIGTATATSAILCLWYIFYEKRIWCLIPLVICVVVGFGAGSRKMLVVLALGAVLLFLLRGNFQKRLLGVLEAAIVLFVLYQLLQLPAFAGINERFNSFLNIFTGEGEVDGSTIKRFDMVQYGLEQFYRTPVGGMGIGNTYLLTFKEIGRETYLHNNYVELLASVGVIGTGLYYAMFLSPLPWLAKGNRRHNPLATLGVVLLVVELVLHFGMVTFYSKSAYMLLLLLALLANEAKKERGQVV